MVLLFVVLSSQGEEGRMGHFVPYTIYTIVGLGLYPL